jgi:arylsulfatase A-like enzyme
MERPNFLIVILDSLRRDHLPVYGYHRDTAPNLTSIARQAAVYDTAISDGGWTPPCIGSLFTGLCGREHNAEERMRLPGGMPTVAEILASEGYHTAAFSTNPFNLPVHGYGRGFERFHSFRHRKGLRHRLARAYTKTFHLIDKGGREATEAILGHLEGCPRPFFGFLHHDEVHMPFGAPRPYTYRHVSGAGRRISSWATGRRANRPYRFMAQARPEQFELLGDLYDGQISYLDSLIGELWGGLQRMGLLDNTVVAFCADHGELLGEDGYLGHAFALNEPLIHIPLIIHAPDLLEPGTRMAGMVQLRDLGRSLCDLAGAWGLADSAAPPVNVFYARGVEDGHDVAFSERRGLPPERLEMEKRRTPHFDFDRHNVQIATARGQRFKFVRTSAGERRLYDLQSSAGETIDVLAAHHQEAAELERRLDDWIRSQQRAGTYEGDEEDTPPEVLERLRDFGYLT